MTRKKPSLSRPSRRGGGLPPYRDAAFPRHRIIRHVLVVHPLGAGAVEGLRTILGFHGFVPRMTKNSPIPIPKLIAA
ncbi:hypothetical protein [Bifidobacterium psychraerophilum]|jgi:hypothetical protein|uniref:hypothetical protein n=1 Tax=Bifidobacterium psychraerophilum TaxID=218140 RepID=UPI0023F239A9|nr:hypothetical protein [Bifidobacterium psychraerophilum]MCI1660694.1 hypothetical protein [Bifidobacterium psychraerophilum]MCI1804034.1 hypothetical protein [Bifidobacterium psychraerophilum]MCI2176605.1 hypothetical protein [Bifidobacterium psychraerophilum]MCI2182351.1 hypothetical protein [Bifidobacterium psychraerophilum]